MKTSYRKFISLFTAVCSVIFFFWIVPKAERYGIRYLVSHRILVRQIYRLDAMGLLSTVLSAASNIFLIICGALALYLLRKKDGSGGKHGKYISPKRLCLSGVWGFGAAELTIFLLTLLPVQVQTDYSSAMRSIGGRPLWYLVFFTAVHIILAAAAEEFLFRELLYRLLEKFWKSILRSLVLSVLFAAVHGNTVQAVYAFFMGLLLCAVREKYDSVLYTMVFHMMFNLFGSGMLFAKWGMYLMYVGTAAFVVCAVLFAADIKGCKSRKKKKGKRYWM